MPIYRVTIDERHEDCFEEVYHAWREMRCQRIYEVEAENAEEAEDMAHNDQGNLVSEDWDYGDTLDSEFYDTGESVTSEYIDCDVYCETIEDYEERYRELMRQQREEMAQARATYASWLRSQKMKREGIDPNAKPHWEV
jgi:hypothetical protein